MVELGEEIFRLFVDPAYDGPTNMAIDACLLRSVEDGAAAALRLYRWDAPTLSLGYFQPFDDAARRDPALAALPVVRRSTGGGAILHADELTYSLALPARHPLARERTEVLYTFLHARIAEAVAELGGRAEIAGDGPLTARRGPFLCFACQARFDLVGLDPAGPARKLAGSAQRRTKGGLLQHGSVVLRRSHPVQPSAAVDELVGRPVSFEEFAHTLVWALRQAGMRFEAPRPAPTDALEFPEQRRLYADEAWTRRR